MIWYKHKREKLKRCIKDIILAKGKREAEGFRYYVVEVADREWLMWDKFDACFYHIWREGDSWEMMHESEITGVGK